MVRGRVIRVGRRSKGNDRIARREAIGRESDIDARVAMIQMLIPLGLEAVEDMLQEEVLRLVGERHSRGGARKRWGRNPGFVFLGDQKLSIETPRVRDVVARQEVPLQGYRGLQNPTVIDNAVLARLVNGISARKYEKAAQLLPETFGIKKSSVSRRFIRATAKKLRELLERDLSKEEIIAIFIDGKTFAENNMIIALGVAKTGKKIVLGFIEASTENHIVCKDFINGLIARGLNVEQEILFIIDGAKGIHKAIKEILGEKGLIQRCQWHKRENVVSYLDKKHQAAFRRKLQTAYEQPTYQAAKRELDAVKRELKLINESAVASLEEGLEETLTLHRLGMFEKLGVSFKTTNCIEALNRQLSIYTGRVGRWQNSEQRQRWVATALLEIEPNLRKIKGHRYLRELRDAMKREVNQKAGKEAA